MQSVLLTILTLAFLTTACTREKDSGVKIKLTMPKLTSTQSAVTTQDFDSTLPSNLNELSCFAVVVSAPHLNDSHCVLADSSGTTLTDTATGNNLEAHFGRFEGLFSAGQVVELPGLPSQQGTIGKVTILGTKSSAGCKPIAEMQDTQMTRPVLIGQQNVDFSPSDGVKDVRINIAYDTANATNMKYLGNDCYGPHAPGDGGPDGGTNPDNPVAGESLFGDGRDGDFITTGTGSIDFKNSLYISGNYTISNSGVAMPSAKQFSDYFRIINVDTSQQAKVITLSGSPVQAQLEVGDEVMWHVAAAYDPNGPDYGCSGYPNSNFPIGSWGSAKITNISGAQITLDKGVIDTTTSTIDNAALANSAKISSGSSWCKLQLFRVPNFNTFTVESGHTLTIENPSAYFDFNLGNGGVIALRAKELKVNGTLVIDMDGRGFQAMMNMPGPGFAGEAMSANYNSPNASGGAGGAGTTGAGGGANGGDGGAVLASGSSFWNHEPYSVALAGGFIYVMDSYSGDYAIQKLDPINNFNATIISNSSNGTGTMFGSQGNITFSPDKTMLYNVDSSSSTLFKINPTSGDRTIVSSPSGSYNVGSGPDFVSPKDVALTGDNTMAFVTDIGMSPIAVVQVNISTGNRNLLSAAGTGTGTNFSSIRGILLHPDSYLIVADVGVASLVKVDPANGNRSDISKNGGAGSGPNFGAITELVLDPTDNNFLYVLDNGTPKKIFRVNLTDGTRTEITNLSDPTLGPQVSIIQNFDITPDGKFALIADSDAIDGTDYREAIFQVNLLTGQRHIVWGNHNGGQAPDYCMNKPSGCKPADDGKIFLGGAGGGSNGQSVATSSNGGGAIILHIEKVTGTGSITIKANGWAGTLSSMQGPGGGAGGTIHLTFKDSDFTGSTFHFEATGGNGSDISGFSGGGAAGGGGVIEVPFCSNIGTSPTGASNGGSIGGDTTLKILEGSPGILDIKQVSSLCSAGGT